MTNAKAQNKERIATPAARRAGGADELLKLDRAVANLAFSLGQDQERFDSELAALREGIGRLTSAVEQVEASIEDAAGRKPTEAEQAREERRARELRSLSHQVGELRRAIGELRKVQRGGPAAARRGAPARGAHRAKPASQLEQREDPLPDGPITDPG